jgi:CRP-like cAMP-binding protein
MGDIKLKELQSKIDILKKHSLFEGLSESTLRSLSFCAIPNHKKLRDVLFDIGSQVNGFYLISQGEVAVYTANSQAKSHRFPERNNAKMLEDQNLQTASPRKLLRTRIVQDPNSLLEEFFLASYPIITYYRAVVASDRCLLYFISFDLLKKTFGASQLELDLFTQRCNRMKNHYRPTRAQREVLKTEADKSDVLEILAIPESKLSECRLSPLYQPKRVKMILRANTEFIKEESTPSNE